MAQRILLRRLRDVFTLFHHNTLPSTRNNKHAGNNTNVMPLKPYPGRRYSLVVAAKEVIKLSNNSGFFSLYYDLLEAQKALTLPASTSL